MDLGWDNGKMSDLKVIQYIWQIRHLLDKLEYELGKDDEEERLERERVTASNLSV